MRARTWAIWIGGIAAGIAAVVMSVVVVVVSGVAQETAFKMMVVAGAVAISTSWEVERLLGWRDLVLAVMIGLCIGAIVAGVWHFDVP